MAQNLNSNPDADFEAFLAETDQELSQDAQYQSDLVVTQREAAREAAFEGDGFDEFMQSENPEQDEFDKFIDDNDSLSAWLDVPLQAVGGFRDAGESIKNLFIEGALLTQLPQLAAEGITGEEITEEDEKTAKKQTKARTALPDVQEAQTTAGAITRPLAQFLSPFVVLSAGAKAVGLANAAGKATPFITGAATDFLAFEGHEQRLSNVINDVGYGNAITEYLEADPDDSDIEGRFKNTLEGAGLGGLTEAVFKAVKFVKHGKLARESVKAAKEVSSKRAQQMVKTAKQITKSKKIESIKDQTIKFDSKSLPPRPNKEEISIPVQRQMAEAMGTTPEEVVAGDIFQKIRKMGVQDELNKVTNIQEEQFTRLRESLPEYMERITMGDRSAADDFIANEFRAFLETDGAAKDAFQDVARALGRRGQSDAVQSANKLSSMLSQANELTKEQIVKSFHNIVEKGGDAETFVKNLRGAQTLDKINKVASEWYINALLSSPKTLLVDTWSNPLWTSVLALERIPAAAMGKIRRGLFHTERAKDAVHFDEARIMMDSYVNSITDALKYISKAHGKVVGKNRLVAERTGKAASSFKNLQETSALIGRSFDNFRIDTQTRFDTPRASRAITAENFELERNTTLGRIVDYTGAVVNSPTAFMQAKDDVAKAILYRGEVQTLAHRRAVMEGLTGSAYQARIKQLTDVPLNEVGLDAQNMADNRLIQLAKAFEGDDSDLVAGAISRQAQEFARRGTFTQELGPIAKAAQTFFNELPGGKVIVPFIKTPVNLVKVFAERTPLAPLSKNIRADIAAGGARADLALGRIAMGSGLLMAGYSLAVNGRLTGEGPKDKAERDTLLQTGWRPRSVLVGDTYVEIGRLDPIASFMQFPANLVELHDQLNNELNGDLEKDVSDYVALNVLAMSNMFLSKSFTASVGEFMETITSQDENKMQRLINFYGSSFTVPNAVAFFANEIDPVMKQADTLWEAIKNKAGAGDIPKRNIFGEPVIRDPQTVGYMIPTSYSTIDKDPLLQKLAEAGAYIRLPGKRLDGVELTVRDHSQFMEVLKETGVRDALDRFVNSEAWEALPDVSETGIDGAQRATKSGMAKFMYSNYVKLAKFRFIQSRPDLQKRIREFNTKLQSNPKATPLTQRVLDAQGISIENSSNPATFNPSGE